MTRHLFTKTFVPRLASKMVYVFLFIPTPSMVRIWCALAQGQTRTRKENNYFICLRFLRITEHQKIIMTTYEKLCKETIFGLPLPIQSYIQGTCCENEVLGATLRKTTNEPVYSIVITSVINGSNSSLNWIKPHFWNIPLMRIKRHRPSRRDSGIWKKKR